MLAPVSSGYVDSADGGLLQRRVANVGLVIALIGCAFVVMRTVAVVAVRQPERMLSMSMLSHYGGVAVSLALWVVCRRGRLSASVIYSVEAGPYHDIAFAGDVPPARVRREVRAL